MSKIEKLVEQLQKKPKTFRYNELVKVMKHFGYREINRGRTSGSAVAFVHNDTGQIIMVHKPHPGKEIYDYHFQKVLRGLRDAGFIDD